MAFETQQFSFTNTVPNLNIMDENRAISNISYKFLKSAGFCNMLL